MDASIREEYLSAQVFTAGPERLHLMLLDAAARFAERLTAAIKAGDLELVSSAGGRLREILTELILSIRRDDAELTKRVRSIYFFLIREIGEAQLARDAGRIEKAIAVLDVERETWRLVCQQQADVAPAPTFADAFPSESFSLQG